MSHAYLAMIRIGILVGSPELKYLCLRFLKVAAGAFQLFFDLC